MHTNTTRATQNATLPRRNRQNPALYQHILSDLAVEADQLKTPVSPTTPTKIRDKNNTKCPIAPHSAPVRNISGKEKDPPRTRQRTFILAAFRPWGGSDDTVTRRIAPQFTHATTQRRFGGVPYIF